MKIYDEIIDYTFVNSFDLNLLKEVLVLPIKKDGIYSKFFTCKDSNLDLLETHNIKKRFVIQKEKIELFLSEVELRTKLFKLSKKSMKNDSLEEETMGEFMQLFINKAISFRTSDIHIESLEKSMVIRFRIDGQLKTFFVFKKEFFSILSSYIKMISKLDITKSRLSQDGRFSFEIENKKYDFRVSTMPTISGESIVIRVLDNLIVNKELNKLGFSNNVLKDMEKISNLKEGLVLIAGPTGSGKSTTLYSLIKKINTEDKKIITVEDPVEYKIEQIQQIQIHEEIGLGFNSVLKNILRQDPDIILIGEIRDRFSLEIAIQASLTGHLVFASIHANSSLETISRLIDLDADPYLLSTTLKYVIAQRLVLCICKECENRGCPKCNFTGFYDRSSLAEVFFLDEKIKSMILKKNFLESINSYLKTISFKTMYDDGYEKVQNNITTLKEVHKVLSF